MLAAAYAAMAVVTVRRRLVRRDAERLVAALLDAVDATAEGLRAGALPDGDPAREGTRSRPDPAERWAGAVAHVARARLDAAYRLHEALGVPLVDLLERVESDLRAGQAVRAGMAVQLSAAHATAAVLLLLPVAGLWVGAALGTRPLWLLLHTPLGAACAVTAAAMQCGGFLWTARMVHAATAEVR
ncbi:type II secretion system F family protein [Dactylosporangium sp. CA-233914]|uniref:type II secretion system F family protein n=1 Tax=Dactylosporangium sp. CA-233914 TaxID=3239934 RepID=UPI003D8FA4BF